MIPQQFIAIDIDGTLYDDHDHFDVQRFNVDYQKLLERQVLLIVATGNSYDAVQTIFSVCPQVKTFVAENGGRIIFNGHDVISHAHPLPILQQLMAFLNEQDYAPNLSSLSGGSQTYIPMKFAKIPVPFYPHHYYFHSLAEINEPVYNVNLNWFQQKPKLAKIQAIIKQINSAFPGQVEATYSGAYGIDILPYGVNKAIGLSELIRLFPERSLADVTAFGDTSNDLEMIREVGTGIAMKNATDDLLKVADAVTERDNNHDGLLFEIEQRFLD